jgi:ELWxxDGT repeat protein
METLERRELLSTSAQLVHDFDFSNISYRNSPISVVAAEESTYAIVWQKDDQGTDYYSIGEIHGDRLRGVEVEGNVMLQIAQVAVGDQLYFIKDQDNAQQELWKTDGTEDGTARVLLHPGERWTLNNLTAFHDQLYFGRNDELWVTDGTDSGTKLVKDLKPSRTWSSHGHTELNGTLFIAVKQRCLSTADFRCHETEIWKSDGTSAGTQFVATIPSDAHIIAATESHLFIEGEQEIWRTDGTAQGTFRLPNTDRAFRFAVTNDRLFYLREFVQPGRDRHELWVTDGTDEGTRFVKTMLLSGNIDGCGIAGLLATGDTVYFAAEDGSGNDGLWKSDGTEEGTVLVKEMRLAPLVAAGNMVYFVGDDETTGTELWRTDGTPEETVQVLDLNPGPEGSLIRRSWAMVGNGLLYFTADDGIHGYDLWRIPLDVQSVERLVGDSNNDGVFDSLDLVKALQAGKYEDGIPQNATFEEGDWNGDGDFDSNDLISALQAGNFVTASNPDETTAAIDRLLADEDVKIAEEYTSIGG